MRRFLTIIAALVVLGFGVWWFLTAPATLDMAEYRGLEGNAEDGALVFAAAGCASCHAAPDSTQEERLVLSGGERFPSPFGTFIAPNISSDPVHGIGGWSDTDLVNAIQRGISPDGAHYFPAFPYTAYANAAPQDIVSLVAYLRTLPASDVPSLPHEVGFPFNIRRNLGMWKILFAHNGWVMEEPASPEIERGRYLVEALGHCGECHTPRDMFGGLKIGEWLGGAPNPSGRGNIPNITPGGMKWSSSDIVAYLETGFTPEFDTAGGLMAEVVRNTAELSDSDREAIAAYLKAVPPVD